MLVVAFVALIPACSDDPGPVVEHLDGSRAAGEYHGDPGFADLVEVALAEALDRTSGEHTSGEPWGADSGLPRTVPRTDVVMAVETSFFSSDEIRSSSHLPEIENGIDRLAGKAPPDQNWRHGSAGSTIQCDPTSGDPPTSCSMDRGTLLLRLDSFRRLDEDRVEVMVSTHRQGHREGTIWQEYHRMTYARSDGTWVLTDYWLGQV